MNKINRHTKTQDETRRAIWRVLEWAATYPGSTKQDLVNVAMAELAHSSPTKAHAIVDTMVAMQYLVEHNGTSAKEYSFEPTVYGTRLLNAFSRYYYIGE